MKYVLSPWNKGEIIMVKKFKIFAIILTVICVISSSTIEVVAHGILPIGTDTVIGLDERNYVDDAFRENEPYIALVYLDVYYDCKDASGKQCQQGGTGFFFNAQNILTAGHLLYCKNKEHTATSNLDRIEIKIVPKVNGYTQVYTITPEIANIYCPEAFGRGSNPDYDYACLNLYNASFPFPTLSFYWASEEELSSNQLYLIGYDVDKVPENSGFTGNDYYLYECRGNYVYNQDERKMYYNMDTEEGMSGSPVLMMYAHEYHVVAVHTNGFRENSAVKLNSGVRITPEIYQDLHNHGFYR